LEELGHGEVVRTRIEIDFGRGSREDAERVREILRKEGVPFNEGLSVPWTTLTALIKEQVQKRKVTFTEDQLRTLGAVVGKIAKPKQRKAE
jgi:hypothetical protein